MTADVITLPVVRVERPPERGTKRRRYCVTLDLMAEEFARLDALARGQGKPVHVVIAGMVAERLREKGRE